MANLMKRPSSSKCLSVAHSILCQKWSEEKHLRCEHPDAFVDDINPNEHKPKLAGPWVSTCGTHQPVISDKQGVTVSIDYGGRLQTVTIASNSTLYESLFK